MLQSSLSKGASPQKTKKKVSSAHTISTFRQHKSKRSRPHTALGATEQPPARGGPAARAPKYVKTG